MPNAAATPAWLAQQDADEAAQQQQPMPAPNQNAPASSQAAASWDKFDPAPGSAVATPTDPNAAVPDWLAQMDAQEAANNSWNQFDPPGGNTAPAKPPQDPSAARNFLTGLLRIPGALIGAPAVLRHFGNWVNAQSWNAVTGGNLTGADLDKNDPLMKVLPTAQGVDNAVFGATGVTPYEPTSPLGKVGQAVTTGLGAGLVDPLAVAGDINRGVSAARAIANTGLNAVKTGLASGAANAADQLAPRNPGLDAGAAFLTHAGLGGVGQVAKFGSGVLADTGRQIVMPTKQGTLEAGRVLSNVDNTQPGIAAPSDTDLASAQGDVNAATGDIGAGLQPWQAGAQLRAGLQTRADTLKATRAATADQAYDGFRAQPPLPATALQPFMQSPSFKKALGAANGAVLDEGGNPLTDYFGLGEDDMPSHLTGTAIPPDVLLRVKSQLGDAVNGAPDGSAAQRTATMLNKRFGSFLEDNYPATEDFPGYASINQGYADASRPLDPMSYGSVGTVLDADKQFGQSRYTFPDERIPDLFLRSNATRADLNQLLAAHGGDRAAAMGSLQDHLAGVAQSAVQPDGTLDTAAFAKAMQPYQKSMGNVGMYFPQLAQKFATAKAAQGTLDTMQAQRGLADAVTNGALRDNESGMVTGQSFNTWLNNNKAAIAKTQSPGAAMRLQSMAKALQGAQPGELADMVKSELLPAAAGAATFGLEGGVLGTLLHKTTQTMFGGLDAKRQAAFSGALERATLDPVFAGQLAANAAKRGGISPARALVRAIAATPIAVNAGGPMQ